MLEVPALEMIFSLLHLGQLLWGGCLLPSLSESLISRQIWEGICVLVPNWPNLMTYFQKVIWTLFQIPFRLQHAFSSVRPPQCSSKTIIHNIQLKMRILFWGTEICSCVAWIKLRTSDTHFYGSMPEAYNLKPNLWIACVIKMHSFDEMKLIRIS